MGVILILLVAAVTSEHPDTGDPDHFNGDQCIQVIPQNETQVKLLQNRESDYGLDFWQEVGRVLHPADIHVQKKHVAEFKEWLTSNGFKYTVLVENLQTIVKQEEQENAKPEHMFSESAGYNYSICNDLPDIHKELKNLAAQKYKDKIATTFSLGKSYEDRDMLGIKVSSGDPPKPAIWVDACIHAREWLTTASVMVFLKQLLKPSEAMRRKVDGALERYDFYVLPVFNVDGYEYSRKNTENRFWRKTRSFNRQDPACRGVDPNRNWDDHFEEKVGSSSNPCSYIYRGKHAFSEIEVKQVTEKLKYLKNSFGLRSYWNVHAFSQLILYPYSWTEDRAKDYDEMKRVGDKFIRGVENWSERKFIAGQPSRILYPVSGSSIDWTYNTLNVKYSYALELRPRDDGIGTGGFLVKTEEIIPSGMEMTNGILDAVFEMVEI